MRFSIPSLAPLAVTLAFAGAGSAHADDQPAADPAAASEPATENPEPGFLDRETLTGDWSGMRKSLSDSGVEIEAKYIGETQGVVSGGLRRGAIYEGRFEISTNIDFEKLLGWEGATLHANAYQIHGRGLSRDFLGNLLPASNIEAVSSTRLFDLWLQQDIIKDRLSIRAGQLAADDDFLLSDTASMFMNATFGWAPLVANNLPSGGPAFPLATPGIRIGAKPAENVTFITGVFSGNPAGNPGSQDPQRHNNAGTIFSLEGGVLVMSEIQYAINQDKNSADLPGTYKLGGFYHTGRFDDLRFDNLGQSLASPSTTGVAARHHGDYGLYAVADQMVWREPGSEDHGVTLFMRIGGAPADRNLIDFYVDGGAAYKGLVPGRDDDLLGIGFGYARISGDAAGFDSDTLAVSGSSGPVRDSESVLELSYIAQVTGWWTVQPDVQFIFQPGGNVPDPNDPTKPVPDAMALGVRTAISF
jgi:porin